MKIAVFGGSFNPVHMGHLALADDVCLSLGYDKVLFVPAFIPPHKKMEVELPTQCRLEMLSLALEGDERFEVEDCEIVRGGTSYTYDTVEYIMKKYAGTLEGKPGLIMGSDLFSGFHLWHRAGELSSMCDLILARRHEVRSSNAAKGDFALAEADRDFDPRNEKLFSRAFFLNNPFVDLSSGEIRERVRSGKSFRYLVGEKVFKYIVSRGLYGDN